MLTFAVNQAMKHKLLECDVFHMKRIYDTTSGSIRVRLHGWRSSRTPPRTLESVHSIGILQQTLLNHRCRPSSSQLRRFIQGSACAIPEEQHFDTKDLRESAESTKLEPVADQSLPELPAMSTAVPLCSPTVVHSRSAPRSCIHRPQALQLQASRQLGSSTRTLTFVAGSPRKSCQVRANRRSGRWNSPVFLVPVITIYCISNSCLVSVCMLQFVLQTQTSLPRKDTDAPHAPHPWDLRASSMCQNLT